MAGDGERLQTYCFNAAQPPPPSWARLHYADQATAKIRKKANAPLSAFGVPTVQLGVRWRRPVLKACPL